MGIDLSVGNNDLKSVKYSQKELREDVKDSLVETVFKDIMGSKLLPFVGHIKTVFKPPKS